MRALVPVVASLAAMTLPASAQSCVAFLPGLECRDKSVGTGPQPGQTATVQCTG